MMLKRILLSVVNKTGDGLPRKCLKRRYDSSHTKICDTGVAWYWLSTLFVEILKSP
jgi:hypothetical protein